jgi:hypothetical protein
MKEVAIILIRNYSFLFCLISIFSCDEWYNGFIANLFEFCSCYLHL